MQRYPTFAAYLKAEYRGPYCATDIAIRYQNGIVLIERKFEPFGIAFPGGMGEQITLAQNAIKEAKEETGLEVLLDNPDQPLLVQTIMDPRQVWMASITYTGNGKGVLKPHEDEDAKRAFVVSYNRLNDLLKENVWAFEHHKKIARAFLEHEGYYAQR